MVPVQTGVSEVRLALQEGRRPLHSLTEVVVVVTECSLHAFFLYNLNVNDHLSCVEKVLVSC